MQKKKEKTKNKTGIQSRFQYNRFQDQNNTELVLVKKKSECNSVESLSNSPGILESCSKGQV